MLDILIRRRGNESDIYGGAVLIPTPIAGRIQVCRAGTSPAIRPMRKRCDGRLQACSTERW
jgi:hypothetical protein